MLENKFLENKKFSFKKIKNSKPRNYKSLSLFLNLLLKKKLLEYF